MIRGWRSAAVRQLFAHHPCLDRQPLGVVLRAPVLAAIVIEVATRRFGQRMDQQPALCASRYDQPPNGVEVLPRLLVGPGRLPGRQRLEPERRPGTVAGNAARVTRALGEKDRLNAGLEEVEVERRRGRRRLGGGPGGECNNEEQRVGGTHGKPPDGKRQRDGQEATRLRVAEYVSGPRPCQGAQPFARRRNSTLKLQPGWAARTRPTGRHHRNGRSREAGVAQPRVPRSLSA